LLKVEFKDVGLRKVEKGQFLIEDSKTNRKIDLSKPWKVCFRPGQRVNMSKIFENLRSGERMKSTCPSCHTVNDCGTGSEGAWYAYVPSIFKANKGSSLDCGTRFQRIKDVSQSVRSKPPWLPPGEDSPKKRVEIFGPVGDDEDEESDVDMDTFTSVTLVSKTNNVEWVGIDGTGNIANDHGVVLEFHGPYETHTGEGWALRAGHPLSPHETGDSICYYEIEILEGGSRK
jgi:hypothetical protein